jgi:hypothetical protein
MEKLITNAVNENSAAFFSLINNPLKLRLYLLKNVPFAFFSGVKIVDASPAACTTSIPYKWLTRNPFRSTYFASLSMAAELSTGVLAMAHIYKRQPSIAMLVTGIEGKFYKKATDLMFFQCTDGEKMKNTIAQAISLRVPQEIKAHSIGRNKQGDTVAEFWINWSFKVR